MSTQNTGGIEELGADGPTPDGSPVVESDGSLPPPTSAAVRDPALDEPTRAGVSDPDAPVLVGVSLEGPLLAREFLLAMGRLRSEGALDLKDAVIVAKSDDGEVKVTETIDPTPGRAALSGGMWTGLLGLLVGGPVGWLAGIGIGAGAGAVTAKIVDLGIPDEWVDWFKQAVPPGTAAVIILAEDLDLGALEREAARFPGAELIESTLPESAIADLEAAFDSH